MNKYLNLCFLCIFFLFSCREKKRKILLKDKIELFKTKKDFVKKDLFTDIFKKIDKKYEMNIKSKNNLDKTLNLFIERNKPYFNKLDTEREAIYKNKKTRTKIFVREWVFNDSITAKKIEKIINKPTYKVISDGIEIVIDTVKEPYFTYRIENKLFVFYVRSVSKYGYINYFQGIINEMKKHQDITSF